MKNLRPSRLLILIFLVFIATRLAPYLTTSVPLGYDAGLYLNLFKQYSILPIFAFTHLSPWLLAGFPPVVPFIGRMISAIILPETFLVPLIVLFSIILFFSVYLIGKRLWDRRTALWCVFIFSISALEFREYWYYYAKQITASSFLLFTVYFILGSSYWAIPFAVLVAYTHEPTFVVLLAALLTGFIMEKSKRKYYVTTGIITLAAAAPFYLSTHYSTIKNLINPIAKSFIPQAAGGTMFTPSGTFYDLLPALALSLPYLPFAVIGLFRGLAKKRNAPIIGALIASLTISIFGLFLSRRFIIFADLFIILFAGYGISFVIGKFSGRVWLKPLLVIYGVALLAFIGIYIAKTGKPLILDDEFNEIKMLKETEADSYILVTDQLYVPYVYGWSERRVIAPGYGEDDIYWTIPEWYEFWRSGDREKEKELLLKVPQPLYIYYGDRGSQTKLRLEGECFERVNWRTYKFVCTK